MKTLSIAISDDQMTAYVSGEIDHLMPPDEIRETIAGTLINSGIIYGIDSSALNYAAEELSRGKSLEPTPIAEGTQPRCCVVADPEFTVPVYDGTLLPVAVDDPSASLLYGLLIRQIPNPHIVKEHYRIGRFTKKEDACAGSTIYGDPLPPPDDIEESILLGAGLLRLNEMDIVAERAGIVVATGNAFRVIPVIMHGAFTIEVPDDRLTALLYLYQAGPEGQNLSASAILAAMREMGIVSAANEQEVQRAIDALSPTHADPVSVAQGIAPVNGDDGRIEYLVNLDFSPRPLIREDGHADYHSIHVYENVIKGQMIARVHPPTQGQDGVDIFGNQLKAVAGKPATMKYGKNMGQHPDDPSVLNSTINGHVYLRNERIEIEEVLRITSDIDYRTGNIQFVGDIEITGEVKSGFSVKAAGTIRIWGAVEDAIVESRNNVIIHAGFIGQGKGRIWAGNDAIIAFVRNQTVMAERNILVSGEIIDAHLHAGDSIYAESAKSWIVGGQCTAKKLIRACNIGNDFGNPTRIQVGIDYIVGRKIQRFENEIDNLKSQYAETKHAAEKLLQSPDGSANQKGLARARSEAMLQGLTEKIARLEQKKQELRTLLYLAGGRIEVTQTVYPSVLLEIASLTMTVREKLHQCLLFLHKGEIVSQILTIQR